MRGVIMSVKGKYAVLLTKSGDFVKVKNKNYSVGNTVNISSDAPRICAVAASLFLVCGGIVSYFIPTGYISVDINPSLLMTVNVYNRVINTKALNDDAEKLLEQADVRTKSTEDAIDILIKKSEEIGYINDNNKDVIIDLVSDINGFNLRNYGQIEVSMEKANREDLRNSQKLGVSIAKAKAIEEYTRQKGGEMLYNADMLKDKSVKEICKEFSDTKDNPPMPEKIITDNSKAAPINEPPNTHMKDDMGLKLQKPSGHKAERNTDYSYSITKNAPEDIEPDKPMQGQPFAREPVPQNPMQPIHNKPVFDTAEQPANNETVKDDQKPQANDIFDSNPNQEQDNDNPNQEQPVKNEPVIDEPIADENNKQGQHINGKPIRSDNREQPPTDDSVIGKPSLEQPPTDDSVIGKPSLEQPPINEPAIDKPNREQPPINEPAIDKPNREQPPLDEPAIDKPNQEQQSGGNSVDNTQNQGAPIQKEPIIDTPEPPMNDTPSREQASHNEPITDNERPSADSRPQENPKPEGNPGNESHMNEREPAPPITEHNAPQPPDTPSQDGGGAQNQPHGNGQEPFDRYEKEY